MKKMNNKGFSLVELIIVIAIMAVLIVVLAPQYLKYVEKSRNSTDVTNATEIVTAIQVYAADPDVASTDVLATGASTITVTTDGGAVTGDTAGLKKAFQAAGFDLDGDKLKTTCVSKTAWQGYTITVTVETNGNVKFEYGAGKVSGTTYTEDAGMKAAFQNAMAGKKTTTTGGGGSTPTP